MNYNIITFGCQMNTSDSERISAVLEDIGYKPTSKENETDLIVVNMCSVRQSAVDRVYGLTQKLKNLKIKKQELKTVLTGCILEEDRKKFKNKFDLILDIKDLPPTFAKTLKTHHPVSFKKVRGLPKWPKFLLHNFYSRDSDDRRKCTIKCGRYFETKPKCQNKFSALVPISNGCNNLCSYCVVPFTRGPLTCRDHKDILREVKNLVKDGVKEIWFLGQNVNDYESRISTNMTTNFREYNISDIRAQISENSRVVNFAKLLKMISDIPGTFKILFTSPHPKNFSDELIETLSKCEKFGKYLNLPVQSGDDGILKRMNRNYTVKEYKNLVKKIRQKIPGIKLSTDVIVGFPGETEKQFQNTVKLFKEMKFNYAYIAKYSPRPGTAAFQLKDNVFWKEKKKREKILREILKNNA